MEINDLNTIISQIASRLAEEKTIVKANTAYKNYLDGKESAHDFNGVVKELGFDD